MIEDDRTRHRSGIDPELVAAHLDGKLLPDERAAVERALARRPDLARELGRGPRSRRRVVPFAVAAALLIAVAGTIAILSREVGVRRVEIPVEVRVLAVAGAPVRAVPPARTDPGTGAAESLEERSRLRVGDRIAAGALVDIGRGDRLLVLGPEGGFRVARSNGVDRLVPPRVVAERLLRAPAGGVPEERSLEGGGPRAVSPAGSIGGRRPTFVWSGSVEPGSTLLVEGIEGEVWSTEVAGDDPVGFPSDRDDLERRSVYRWSVVGPSGRSLWRQTFLVAGEDRVADADRSRTELAEIESPILRDAMLLLFEDDLALQAGVREAIRRLAGNPEGRQALEALQPALRRASLRRLIRQALDPPG